MQELLLHRSEIGPGPIFKPEGGQLLFTQAGVHVIEVDLRTPISIVCIGGSYRGGAGTSYRNGLTVGKGSILEITVGGVSNDEMESVVKLNGSPICIAYGPTGDKFEIGGLGGKAAASYNTGGGNGGDARYSGAYNLGCGGAGGYNGKGGDSGVVNSSWSPTANPTAGQGGGGGGGHGGRVNNTNYIGLGGGVSITPPNGVLNNGIAGLWATSNNSTRYGGQGSGSIASMRTNTYGGGRGSRSPGVVRIMWGVGRQYPNQNTADV